MKLLLGLFRKSFRALSISGILHLCIRHLGLWIGLHTSSDFQILTNVHSLLTNSLLLCFYRCYCISFTSFFDQIFNIMQLLPKTNTSAHVLISKQIARKCCVDIWRRLCKSMKHLDGGNQCKVYFWLWINLIWNPTLLGVLHLGRSFLESFHLLFSYKISTLESSVLEEPLILFFWIVLALKGLNMSSDSVILSITH